jgi:hypothetical protein
MNLVLHIPARSLEDHPGALRLAQRAPTFTIEWMHGEQLAIAIFPSLPDGIDLAVDLVGESLGLTGAWASINAKPMSNLVGLWHRLVCYRDSLTAADPVRYCRERSAEFNALAVCAGQRTAGPCRFIAMAGDRGTREENQSTGDRQYEAAARLAEIDWCPRLNLPRSGFLVKHPISPTNGDPVRV